MMKDRGEEEEDSRSPERTNHPRRKTKKCAQQGTDAEEAGAAWRLKTTKRREQMMNVENHNPQTHPRWQHQGELAEEDLGEHCRKTAQS